MLNCENNPKLFKGSKEQIAGAQTGCMSLIAYSQFEAWYLRCKTELHSHSVLKTKKSLQISVADHLGGVVSKGCKRTSLSYAHRLQFLKGGDVYKRINIYDPITTNNFLYQKLTYLGGV